MLEPKFLLDVASLVLSFVVAVFAWWTRHNEAAVRMHETLAKQVDANGYRIASLETVVQAIPGKGDYHKLDLEMAGVRGEMSVMNERMRPVTAQLARIENFLIENARETGAARGRRQS